jgi:hypothetical protein
MLEIEETNFCSIDSFPLKWRWIDSRYNELPSNALSKIQPLVEIKARELFQHSKQFYNFETGLAKSLFENIKQINASGEFDEIQHWLLACSSNSNQTVIVSWNNRFAALVEWKVFCEYWDDFCYPASDDVAIFPFSEEWALLYSHEEYFIFGNRRDATAQHNNSMDVRQKQRLS